RSSAWISSFGNAMPKKKGRTAPPLHCRSEALRRGRGSTTAEVVADGEAQRRAAVVILEVQAGREVRREVPAATDLERGVGVVDVHVFQAAVQLELAHRTAAHAHAEAETPIAVRAVELGALDRTGAKHVHGLVDRNAVADAGGKQAAVDIGVVDL